MIPRTFPCPILPIAGTHEACLSGLAQLQAENVSLIAFERGVLSGFCLVALALDYLASPPLSAPTEFGPLLSSVTFLRLFIVLAFFFSITSMGGLGFL